MKKISPANPPKFDRRGYQINIKDLNGEPLPDLTKLNFQPFNPSGRKAASVADYKQVACRRSRPHSR